MLIYENLDQWNTYGDPPNSDLLRRYGHVDLVPLADGSFGNPADIVEIRADLVMEVILQNHPEWAGPRSAERVDWWLEEGGDECAVLSHALVSGTLIFSPQHVCGRLFERCAGRVDLFRASFDDVSARVGKNEAQVQAAETQGRRGWFVRDRRCRKKAPERIPDHN